MPSDEADKLRRKLQREITRDPQNAVGLLCDHMEECEELGHADLAGEAQSMLWLANAIAKEGHPVLIAGVVVQCDTYNEGDFMKDSQKAGGDINASAAGKGQVKAGRDINIYSNVVTKSDLDPKLQEALKDAFLAIEELDEDRAVKDKALSELRGLTDELMKDKEERSERVIGMCWRTVADFGRDVVAISRLGEILLHMGLIISTSM